MKLQSQDSSPVLSHSPLALVLCQVRFASIRNIEQYIPKLQDTLRQNRFPIDKSTPVRELLIDSISGKVSQQHRQHWEFRTYDETWSCIVNESAVVFQTTKYNNFDDFCDQLSMIMNHLSNIIGSLIVERIGLRYINVILPHSTESWRDYLIREFHGLQNEVIAPENTLFTARTVIDTDEHHTLIIQLHQNRERQVLPSDLLAHHPRLQETHNALRDNTLITLLDIDHFLIRRHRFDTEVIVSSLERLHESIDTIFLDVVTEHALATWR